MGHRKHGMPGMEAFRLNKKPHRKHGTACQGWKHLDFYINTKPPQGGTESTGCQGSKHGMSGIEAFRFLYNKNRLRGFTREAAVEPLQNKNAKTVGRATKRAARELTGDDGNFVVTTDLGNEFATLDRELRAATWHAQVSGKVLKARRL